MGAAQTPDGESQTELFVGDDQDTAPGQPDAPVAPSWATIAQSLPVEISPASVTLSGTGSATIDLYASGENLPVTAALSGPAAGWSVTPASCALAAATTCALTVTASPAAVGTTDTLNLSWPGGQRAIPLAGQSATSLAAVGRGATIVAGSAAMISARLRSAQDTALAGEPVALEAGSAPVATASTTGHGSVSFRVTPTTNTTYAVVFKGTPALGPSRAGPFAVLVAPRVDAAFAHRTVAVRHAARLSGRVMPAQPGRRVTLQRRRGHRWVTAGRARLGRTGRFALTVRPGPAGRTSYRVRVAATRQNVAGTSRTITVRVTG